MACESMNRTASQTLPIDVVSLDGAWDHCRNGTECQAVFINTRTDKFVYVQQVNKSLGNVVGNFKGASGNMESKTIRRAIPKLKQINFKGYTHDNDNKTRNIFQNNWKELEEHLAPKHVKKALERKFEKYNKNNL